MIHLEGFGVLGCYLALRLEDEGVRFTWSDIESPVNAWVACTGAIFPTGHDDDLKAHDVWLDHLDDDRFHDHMELGEYVFCTKNPPHGGQYETEVLAGPLKRPMHGPLLKPLHPSIHLNAQAWVPATRERYRRLRRDGPEWGDTLVRAHGFGSRLERYMWGWTAAVKVELSEWTPRRPAIYLRRGRFVMAYAYPIPGTPHWYAGSSLISQRVPNSLRIPPKYTKWRDTLRELGGGAITKVERCGPFVEGWRPVPPREPGPWVDRQRDGSLAVRPLWHSGVRHAPLVADALLEQLP